MLVGEGEWRQHVGFDAVFEPVPDGAQIQIVGFDGAEVALKAGHALIGGHDAGRVEGFRRYRGAMPSARRASTASGKVVLRFPVETSLAPPSRNVSRSATVLASR